MSRESPPWRQWAGRALTGLWGLFAFLMGALLVLVVLGLIVGYVAAVVEDLRSDSPEDCSDWRPGKVAESPYDLACEGQWDDQLNELNP